MGILDAPMAGVAKTLVGTFGRAATFRWYTTPSYNDASGGVAATPTDVACSVVVEEFADSQIDESSILRSDRIFVVARSVIGREPVDGRDEFIEGGRTWKIVRVVGLSSGASEAAYRVHVRR